MGIREKLGQFSGFARPGCTCLMYPCENIVGKLSTRVQQLSVNTQTKTKDNVTLTVAVAVQFRVTLGMQVSDGRAPKTFDQRSPVQVSDLCKVAGGAHSRQYEAVL